jgi:diguanylate cyclase
MSKNDESPKTVADIAKKVIVNSTERAIPLTPENYYVWFEYFLGFNKDLEDAINVIINSKGYFSEETNRSLYNEFINQSNHEVLEEIQKESYKIFQNILRASLSTNDAASTYSGKMKGYYKQLNDTHELTHIQKLLEEIIKDTHDMAASSYELNQKLDEATAQIQSLSRQLEETKREVLLDGLTGLNNRRSFDRKIKELCEQFDGNVNTFSVIMLDIDYFKKFNDQHGHQTGDAVLSIVGGLLKETLKGKDFPSRYGGEEFIILLPRTRLEGATAVAEQIRETISSKKFKNTQTGQKLGNITVSIGVAEIQKGDTAITVVERADAALYMAKASGRNNVKTEEYLESV